MKSWCHCCHWHYHQGHWKVGVPLPYWGSLGLQALLPQWWGGWRGNSFLGTSAISKLVRLAGATSMVRGITAGSAAMVGYRGILQFAICFLYALWFLELSKLIYLALFQAILFFFSCSVACFIYATNISKKLQNTQMERTQKPQFLGVYSVYTV